MRWAIWISITLLALLVIYFASPLIALQSIAAAVESRDAAALMERIDFPAVRRSLRRQIANSYRELTGKVVPLGAIEKRFAVSVADPLVARLMTVSALLELLGKGKAGKATVGSERAPFTPDAFKSVWRLWLDQTI